ncbi:MAG: tetratricopeptide repeat protein [Geminicoccaceae bacterium]
MLLLTVAACSAQEQASLREPDDSSRLRVASVAEANGQPSVALSIYSVEATGHPDDAEAQVRYATALMRAGGVAQANEVLTRALQRMPDEPELLIQSGKIRLLAGDAGAGALFDRALTFDPSNASALSGKGMALDLAGHHDEALPWHAAAMKAAPDNLIIGNNHAVALMLVGRTGEAIAILNTLAQRQDAPDRVMNNLALAYAMAGHPDEARSVLRSHIGEVDFERYARLMQLTADVVHTPRASPLPRSTP